MRKQRTHTAYKKTKSGFIFFLVLMLLVPALTFSGMAPKAQGASFKSVVDVTTTYALDNDVYFRVTFSDESKAYFHNNTLEYPYDANILDRVPGYYRDRDGYIWNSSTNTKISSLTYTSLVSYKLNMSGVVAPSYFALTTDGKVHAWGEGIKGQLGTGSVADRTTPGFVKNGLDSTDLTGVKRYWYILIWVFSS